MKKSLLLLIVLIFALPIVYAEEISNTSDPFKNLDNKLDQQITLPNNLDIALRFMLGIKQSPTLTLSLLALLGSLWLIAVLITGNALALSPVFDKVTRWIGAIAIVTIGSATGLLENIGLFLLNAVEKITFFVNWSSGALIFIILVIIALALVIKTVLRPVIEHVQKTQEQNKGFLEGIREARRRAKEDITDELDKRMGKNIP